MYTYTLLQVRESFRLMSVRFPLLVVRHLLCFVLRRCVSVLPVTSPFLVSTLKQRCLRYDSYIVRMTSRDVTLTQRQRTLWIYAMCASYFG